MYKPRVNRQPAETRRLKACLLLHFHLYLPFQCFHVVHLRPLRAYRELINEVNIQGTDNEMVTSYKYLVVHLNNKLDWTDHTVATYKKGQSRLYLLMRIRSFGVQQSVLTNFYKSVVASAIFYGVV